MLPQEVCRVSAYSTSRLLLKREATFCLEPAGDSPSRKSIGHIAGMDCNFIL